MAQSLSVVPEGDRLPNIFPVEFWSEQVPTVVKIEVEKEFEVITRDEFDNEVKKTVTRKVPREEVEYVSEDYVKWMRKGDNKTAVDIKIRLLKKTDPLAWKALKGSYEAWKKGEDMPDTGTPLGNWPMIRNKRQVEQLKMIGIRTVEDLAGMPDAMLQNIGMGARTLRDRAKAFIEVKGNQAQFATLLVERDERLEKQASQIEELQKNLDTLTRNMPQKEKPKDVAKHKE